MLLLMFSTNIGGSCCQWCCGLWCTVVVLMLYVADMVKREKEQAGSGIVWIGLLSGALLLGYWWDG